MASKTDEIVGIGDGGAMHEKIRAEDKAVNAIDCGEFPGGGRGVIGWLKMWDEVNVGALIGSAA